LQFLQQNNVAVGGEVFVASLQVTLLCHLQVAAYAQLVHVWISLVCLCFSCSCRSLLPTAWII